jgi:hypothetical protein
MELILERNKGRNYLTAIPNKSGKPRSPIHAANKVIAISRDDKTCNKISFMTILQKGKAKGIMNSPAGI